MYRVDIDADLNDEDDTGYVWTFLDEAHDPSRVTPGALVVAGDDDAAAVCQVVDLVPAGYGTTSPSPADKQADPPRRSSSASSQRG